MMWTLLTLAVLCASPAQGELLATETCVNVGSEMSGSWRFVSIDTKSGNLTAKSLWSVRLPWAVGTIGILEGVVNGELLVQKESPLAISGYDHESGFEGYATWKRGNLNLPGSTLVFPNASGQPQMLSTFGVPGAMWAVHDTTSIHTVNDTKHGTHYTAHTFELSSIADSAQTSLTHLATLGPYGGVIRDPEDGDLWPSAGTMPLFPGEHAYHVTGDANNAYVMIRYDEQNIDLETYRGYHTLYEFILWRVPTNTSEAPINKTFLNNNITIPCFKEFEFIFKKPNGDGKLLVIARSNCNTKDTGDAYWVMYELDIEAFDSPTNTSWAVRADTRKGWEHREVWGPYWTYDAAKEVLYTMGLSEKYDVYATDLSTQDVTTKDMLVINDPQPDSETGTTYQLSGLAFIPDSEGVSSVYV